ncbi:MAG: hypothetical protein LUE26_06620 [Alistipes sp.]|nr:hypothetical protein [Alistipes sp.]
MKKLSVRAGLLLTLAFLLTFHGCVKEPGDAGPGDMPGFSVADARAFYETASAENAFTRSGEENPYRIFGFHTGDYEPVWQYAEHSMNQWIESVDVPVFGEFYYTGWFASDWTTATDTTGCYFAPVLQKLVVVRHRDEEEATGYYIMSIIPSEDYIHQYGDPDHDSFRNGAVPDTFSGLVIYTIPETAFIVRADRYHDGIKLVWASIFDDSQELAENMRDIRYLIGYMKMVRYHTVTTRITAKDEEQCLWGGEIEGVTCSGSAPRPPVVVEPNIKPPITGVPDPSPPSGGSIGGGSGNGGSGGVDRGNDNGIRSLYDGIFDVSGLTDEQKGELNELMSKLMSDCVGATLQNALSSLLGNSLLNIKFDPNAIASTFNNGTIVLNKMNGYDLIHEMFHSYQAYQESVTTWNSASANLEVECLIMSYKYLQRHGTQNQLEDFERNAIGRYIVVLSDYIGSRGQLIQNATPTAYNNNFLKVAKYIADIDKNLPQPLGYNADMTRNFEKNIGSLTALSEDC